MLIVKISWILFTLGWVAMALGIFGLVNVNFTWPFFVVCLALIAFFESIGRRENKKTKSEAPLSDKN